jgi:cobalt-zinc-cadmium efflux system protein
MADEEHAHHAHHHGVEGHGGRVGGGHDHGHHHAPRSFGKAFAFGLAINLAFVAVEVVYGLRAHSLALLADAGHNVGDVLGLGLAWGASVLSRAKPSKRRTYGMRRVSILAAMFNALFILMVTGGVAWEAIQRLFGPSAVAGREVMFVAMAGVVVNGGAAWLFVRGRDEDLNVHVAFLHLAADAAVSFAVGAAGFVITQTSWFWLDPAASLAVSVLIVMGAWSILRKATNLALDAVPDGIDLDHVRAYLDALPNVVEVHDLHVWAVSSSETLLTAHLVVDAPAAACFVSDVCSGLQHRFHIHHATIQVERDNAGEPCRLAAEGTL